MTALRPSTTTGDIAVTIELDPTGSAGFIHTDTIRLTATKMEILGGRYGETQFVRRDRDCVSGEKARSFARGRGVCGVHRAWQAPGKRRRDESRPT